MIYYEPLACINIGKKAIGLFQEKEYKFEKEEKQEISELEKNLWEKEKIQDDIISDKAKIIRKNLLSIQTILDKQLLESPKIQEIRDLIDKSLDELIPEAN